MALPTEEEQNRLHKYFGIEYNNAAWPLGTKERTPQEDQDFLDYAHASKLHWQSIGTELQKMRGLLLVAHAHASVGLGKTALPWARECTKYFTSQDTENWELAFTHMIHAQAAHAAGESAEHAEQYQLAKDIVDAMPEDKTKEIVNVTWVRIPKP